MSADMAIRPTILMDGEEVDMLAAAAVTLDTLVSLQRNQPLEVDQIVDVVQNSVRSTLGEASEYYAFCLVAHAVYLLAASDFRP